MALAIFDLDHTLIHGDSDYEWLLFLCRKGAIDTDEFQAKNDAFYVQYEKGELDMYDYLDFALQPLTKYPLEEIKHYRDMFMLEVVENMLLPKAQALLDHHRQAGDHILLITATNEFVARPIANRLNIDDCLAIDLEKDPLGQYTGKPKGTLSFKEGKISKLAEWNKSHDYSMAQTYFYSDSYNDLPLLNVVGHPRAANPCNKLKQHALQHHWPILNLK